MSSNGFKGLGYPFRINSQGGAVMTTTSKDDSSHIDDSIRQILSTYESERPMEMDIFCNIDTALFEPNNDALSAILTNIIAEDLNRLEERISVDEEDIELSVDTDSNGIDTIYVTITYKVLKYNTYTTSTFKIGEVE